MAGHFNCNECGKATYNLGLCTVCLAAKKQIEFIDSQTRAQKQVADNAAYAAEADRRRELAVEREIQAERDRERRANQTLMQNIGENPLSLFESFECLYAAIKEFMQSGGLEGAKAAYTIRSIEIKMTNLIDKVVIGAIQSWHRHLANLKIVGRTLNAEEVEQWFTKFCKRKPSTSPANLSAKEIRMWLKSEVGKYMYEENKWNSK